MSYNKSMTYKNNVKQEVIEIKRFSLRLTDEQNDILTRKANEAGKSINGYLISLINSDCGLDGASQSYEELKDIIREEAKEIKRKIENLKNY